MPLTWFDKTSLLRRRWLAWAAGASLLLLIFLLYPFQSTIVPVWRLQVVDESGERVKGIKVTEHWQHYLIESSGHEEARQTGEDGLVEFPRRAARAGIITRIIDLLMNLLNDGRGAKFEPYASLVVWGSADHETAVASYKPGTTPQNVIVVHRR